MFSTFGPGITSGSVIRYNYVHDTDSCGIRLDDGVGNSGYYNTVVNASRVTSCAGIIAQFGSVNTNIYNNTVSSTANGFCIWLTSDATGGTVRNNRCLNNAVNSIQNDSGATVDHNGTL